MSEPKRTRLKNSRLAWLLVCGALLAFAGVNAHLVYVAFASQPDCIDHLKEAGTSEGKFRAAKSAC